MRTLKKYISFYKSNECWNKNKTGKYQNEMAQYKLLGDTEIIRIFQGYT